MLPRKRVPIVFIVLLIPLACSTQKPRSIAPDIQGSQAARSNCTHESSEGAAQSLAVAWEHAARDELDLALNGIATCASRSGCWQRQGRESQLADAQFLKGLIHCSRGEAGLAKDAFAASMYAEPRGWAAPYAWTCFESMALQLGDLRAIVDVGRKLISAGLADVRFRNMVSFSVAMASHRSGNTDLAADLFEELAFVDAWAVVGPFNNIAGSGFTRVFAPETSHVRSNVYHDDWDVERAWRVFDNLQMPWIDLEGMYLESAEAVYYGSTHFETSISTDALLHLGVGGFVKVWLNGALVFAVEDPRMLHDDLYQVPVQLAPGTNSLLVKVGTRTGVEPGFSARMTDLQQHPLSDIRWHAACGVSDEGAQAEQQCSHDLSGVPANASRAVATDDWWLYAQSLTRFEAQPNLKHAIILAMQADNGDQEQEFLDLYSARATQLPASSLLLQEVATAHAAIGDESARKSVLQIVRHRNASNLAGVFVSMQEANAQNDYAEGTFLLESHLSKYPRSEFALGALVFQLAAYGSREAFQNAMERLADVNMNAPWAAVKIAAHKDQALGGNAHIDYLERQWRKNGLLPEIAAQLMFAYERAGDTTALKRLLRACSEMWPTHEMFPAAQASLYLRLGDVQEAERFARKALDLASDSAVSASAMAQVLQAKGDWAEAGKWYRKALQSNPDDWNTRTRYLSLSMQRGLLLRFYEDKTESVVSRDRTQPTFPEAHAYYVLADCQRVVLDDLASRATYRRIGRVNDAVGAERFTQMELEIPENTFWYTIDKVVTIKPDGTELQGEAADYSVSFIDLKPGDYFELVYTAYVTCLTPMGREVWQSYLLIQDEPVRKSRFQLIHPRVLDLTMRDLPAVEKREKRITGTYTHTVWTAEHLPGITLEPGSTGSSLYGYLVDFTSVKNWNEVGLWYGRQTNRRPDSNDLIVTTARQIVDGLTDRNDRIEALARYVTSQVTNSNPDFIVEAVTPTDSRTVLQRGVGDCKDQSALLLSMARSIGIEGTMALVHTEFGRDYQFLPSIRFDHVVVRFETQERTYWIDPTASFNDPSTTPTYLQGAPVLLLDGDESRMVEIPIGDARENSCRIETRLVLDHDGRGMQTSSVLEKGDIAASSRWELSETDESQHRDVVQSWYAPELGSFVVTRVSFPDELAVEKTLQFEFDAACVVPLSRLAGRLTLSIPFQMRLRPLTNVNLSQRETPYDVTWMRGVLSERVDIELTGNLFPVELPDPVQLEIEEASYSFQVRVERNGRIVVEREIVVHVLEIAPSRCMAFQRFMEQVAQAERSMILLAKS